MKIKTNKLPAKNKTSGGAGGAHNNLFDLKTLSKF